MKKVLSVLLTLFLIIGILPLSASAADGEPNPDPAPSEELQLYFTHLDWMPDGNPHLPQGEFEVYPGSRLCPGEEHWVALGYKDENDKFVPVPADQLTADPGLHITPAAEIMEYGEGDPDIPCYVRLTVDDFFKEYKISYEDYSITIDSFLPLLSVMSKPELSEENYVARPRISPVDPGKVFYLMFAAELNGEHGRPDSPEKTIQSISLDAGEGANDKFQLKETENGAYALSLKEDEEVPTEGMDLKVTVRYTEGEETEEQIYEEHFYIDVIPFLAYSDTCLGGGQELGDNADKLHTELTMEVGESKDIYIYRVFPREGEGWFMRPAESTYVNFSDSSVLGSKDYLDEFYQDGLKAEYLTRYTVTANQAGVVSVAEGSPILQDLQGNRLDMEEFLYELAEIAGFDPDPTPFYVHYKPGKVEFYLPDTDELISVDAEYEVIYGGESYGEGEITVTVNAASTPTPTATPTATPDFSDMPENQEFVTAITWAVEKGITTGTGAGKFSPNQGCTRAQIVTFLWRAAGKPDVPTTTVFSDLPSNTDFQKAISWAVANNITTGTGGGKFSPNATCTRDQAVTFIWRANDRPTASAGNSFTDAPKSGDFQKAIDWAVEKGIAKGTGGGKFSPKKTCTRAEIVTFIYRAEPK